MFEWLKALKAGDPLHDMMEEFHTMMDNAAWMFSRAVDVLEHKTASAEVADELYARDKKINKSQRRIRKRIVRHLTVQPESDMPGCLVMMSIVKDAERLGDYSKNLFEVAERFSGNLNEGNYGPVLLQRLHQVATMFDKSCRAYTETDESLAHEVVAIKNEVSAQCDQMLWKLFDDELPTNHAVSFALLLRYTKRITNHLYNIASAVIEPVHKVDYADE